MEEKQAQLVSNNLTKQIRCLSIDKEALRKLLQILVERCRTACELELSNFQQVEQSNEEYQKSRTILEESFEVRITVNGVDGKQLIGEVDNIINSANFPDDIKSIYISSDSVLKGAYNYTPRNFFQIFFDFFKPNIFDFSLMPSQATPNGTVITVSGYDATWVHGVFNELDSFVKKNPSNLNWIHKNGIYDLLLCFFAVPIGFWSCYKLSGFLKISFGSFSVFLQNAVYVYIFLMFLFIFRIFFHYARWIFPTVEFRSDKNKGLKHRITLGVLAISILGSVIASVIIDICKS